MTRLADAPVADLSIAADTSEIRKASAWLVSAGSEWRVPADTLWRLELCVNEALANAIGHGGAQVLSDKVRLRFEVCRGHGSAEAQVTVSDGGAAFDPLGGVTKPSPRTLEEAVPGGLGVPLLRHFSDRLSYRRGEEHNHLTFSVRWEEAP